MKIEPQNPTQEQLFERVDFITDTLETAKDPYTIKTLKELLTQYKEMILNNGDTDLDKTYQEQLQTIQNDKSPNNDDYNHQKR